MIVADARGILVELTLAKVTRYCATSRKILKKKRFPDDRYCFLALPYFGPIFIAFGCAVPHRAERRDVVRSFNRSERFFLI